jgi:hypothetical protein
MMRLVVWLRVAIAKKMLRDECPSVASVITSEISRHHCPDADSDWIRERDWAVGKPSTDRMCLYCVALCGREYLRDVLNWKCSAFCNLGTRTFRVSRRKRRLLHSFVFSFVFKVIQ